MTGNIIANPDDFEDEITRETLKSVINVKKIQQSNGERGMHRYIISNSDTVEDVMNVLHYLKYAVIKTKK
jgi:phosphoenolpyruvate carboxylase